MWFSKNIFHVALILLIALTSQNIFSLYSNAGLQNFDNQPFLDNGPHQQGTVKIDRSKLQTVVTWCSPTLLEMRVYDGVNDSFPTLYRKIGDKNKNVKLKKLTNDSHPLQVSVTVFTPTLPFEYTTNFSDPTYATSVCSPSSIHTTLSSDGTQASKLQYGLGTPYKVDGKKMAVAIVDCNQAKSGFYETGDYKGPAYGKEGGDALLPAGAGATVTANCQSNGFTINIK